MNRLECQIFHKTCKLVKSKYRTFREFENLILEHEYIDLINVIDEQEENLNDASIFGNLDDFKYYEESYRKEVLDMEESRIRILEHFECKISSYKELSKEEALEELEQLIEGSKESASEYFENIHHSIKHLIRKLRVIKHILFVENRFKKFSFNFLTIQKNLNNLSHIITASNAQKILISNIEKLETSIEKKFQNLLQLFEEIHDVRMNPCLPENVDTNCPSLSGSSISSNDELYVDEESENSEIGQQEVKKASDCFFVDRSSANTRVDSIERLKTDVDQLQDQIESIAEEKLRIVRQIEEKKNEILEALAKVAEFEENIDEIEGLIADQLYNFQQRLISLETKLMNNFQDKNDEDLKNLLENEIYELKENFREQSFKDEQSRNEFTQQAQIFAVAIGDVIDDIHKFCASTEVNEKITQNIEKLQKLLQRPAQYCHDSNGRRFYFNKDRVKVFQEEYHTSHYTIDSDGIETIVRDGFPIDTDESGEFYSDFRNRKIYIKYYFEDDFGRYYIDIRGDRCYNTDSEASEYMLINGTWVKTKEGTYERDEKGMRVKQAVENIDMREDDEDEKEEVIGENIFETASTNKHKISADDMKYIKESVGPAIIKACAATYLHKPSDPLNYFANFLLHYRYTEKMFIARDQELKYFIDLRNKMKQNCDEKK